MVWIVAKINKKGRGRKYHYKKSFNNWQEARVYQQDLFNKGKIARCGRIEMARRHEFAHKVPKRVGDLKSNTGVDYAIWVQNCELENDELAVLLDIDVRYIKRMRKLDWIPDISVRERIDHLILTRRT